MEVRRNLGALELRTIGLIESPAFLALTAVGLRRAIQVLTLANIEAGKVAACGKGRPNNALAVNVHTARIEAAIWNSKDRGLARFGRVVAALQANQHARE